jgi:hypothetical protein
MPFYSQALGAVRWELSSTIHRTIVYATHT